MHRSTGVFRRLALLSGGSALVVGATVAALPATPASAAGFSASGWVSCAQGWRVVGVWVNAGGSSGWASISGPDKYGETRYDRSIGVHPTYTLNVGCGGTPSSWATNNYAQGGLLGMYGSADYVVSCNDRGSCSAFGYDGGVE